MALTLIAGSTDTSVPMHRKVPARCSVLVVDDDDLVRAQLCAWLSQAGYEVTPAASGEEAMRLLRSLDCRVVVADWQMPGMDGLALCRYVRLKHSVEHIYFLMLTVRDHRHDILRGLAAGADDYITKGTPKDEILARLDLGRRLMPLRRSVQLGEQQPGCSALTDALTGARNRSYLTEYLPREIERARHYGRPLALLRCDIDTFTQLNDAFGQRAGDEVLQWFVGCALNGLREALDWIARIGKDEFVVILPETTLPEAVVIAHKLRAAVVERPIVTCAGALHCTVNIGSAALETAQQLGTISAIELLRQADHGLYASKRRVGNRGNHAFS